MKDKIKKLEKELADLDKDIARMKKELRRQKWWNVFLVWKD